MLTLDRDVDALPREGDGEPFKGKMKRLDVQYREQRAEGTRLEVAIVKNLMALGFWERGA